jgi:DNA/RNA endonuclease YhcR with UshA esterase domain
MNIDLADSNIKDIKADEFVKIKGIVESVNEREKVAFVNIIQPEQIEVVLFKDKENLDLQTGDYVEVSGKSEVYNGEMQIVASVVEKIK